MDPASSAYSLFDDITDARRTGTPPTDTTLAAWAATARDLGKILRRQTEALDALVTESQLDTAARINGRVARLHVPLVVFTGGRA